MMPGPLIRCDCGSDDLVSVAPGGEDEHGPGGILVARGTLARGWCAWCWPWSKPVQTDLEEALASA